MTNFSIIVIGLILKYLLTLSLVSDWSDVSKNLHKDGHWFADIVLLIFWYVYISSIKFLIFLHRRFGLPVKACNLPQWLMPQFIIRASSYAALRRLDRKEKRAQDFAERVRLDALDCSDKWGQS